MNVKHTAKFLCPYCDSPAPVKHRGYSRKDPEGMTRRVRICEGCSRDIKTVEIPESEYLKLLQIG